MRQLMKSSSLPSLKKPSFYRSALYLGSAFLFAFSAPLRAAEKEAAVNNPPIASSSSSQADKNSSENGANILPPSFANLVDKLLPAVVNISISAVIKSHNDEEGEDSENPHGQQAPHFAPGSPLEKFFHEYTKKKHGKDAPERQIEALGSGFVIDPSGIIVTNNHVIDNAQQITVTFHDGSELPARIIGRDSKVDLAVLQVKPAHPLPFVPWGKSDNARIGDWVLAIGNPLGLGFSVTSGIISSRKRNVEHGLYDDFIQTDAAINRGNSGGPLFNLKGEVIGINTLIYGGAGGGSIGLGFSIPSDDARGLVAQMEKTGHVTRGWLGVSFQNVTPGMAHVLDYKMWNGTYGKGAIIADVKKNSPASSSGLAVGDIFVKVENEFVTAQTLPRLVAEHQPGEKVHFLIWHKGAFKTVLLTLGTSPEKEDILPSDIHQPAHIIQTLDDLGMTISVIGADERQEYGLSDGQKGVLVTRVKEGSLAAQRGLKEGSIILQVGQNSVNTPDGVLKELQRARNMKKEALLLLVQDDNGTLWVPLPLE